MGLHVVNSPRNRARLGLEQRECEAKANSNSSQSRTLNDLQGQKQPSMSESFSRINSFPSLQAIQSRFCIAVAPVARHLTHGWLPLTQQNIIVTVYLLIRSCPCKLFKFEFLHYCWFSYAGKRLE